MPYGRVCHLFHIGVLKHFDLGVFSWPLSAAVCGLGLGPGGLFCTLLLLLFAPARTIDCRDYHLKLS